MRQQVTRVIVLESTFDNVWCPWLFTAVDNCLIQDSLCRLYLYTVGFKRLDFNVFFTYYSIKESEHHSFSIFVKSLLNVLLHSIVDSIRQLKNGTRIQFKNACNKLYMWKPCFFTYYSTKESEHYVVQLLQGNKLYMWKTPFPNEHYTGVYPPERKGRKIFTTTQR